MFLTLVVTLAMCGTVLAQSHWPEFDPNNNPYEMQGGLVAAIIINGEPITTEYEGWETLEIAAFVGDNIRANGIYLNDEFVLEFGDPYPVTWGDAVFYTNPGETLTFKMYDHSRGIEYSFVTALQYGEPLTLYTGEEHYEGWDAAEDVISLSFISSGPTPMTMTLEIEPYTGERDNYYLIAAPFGAVDASAVEGLNTPNFDFYSFDQAAADGKEWINLRESVDQIQLQSGVGYLYANNTGTDLTFTGQPLDEESREIQLVYTEEEVDWPGWNLVGNPFEVSVYPDRPFYTMNEDRSGYASHSANDELPAMCGAFVQATEVGQNVTMHKTPANKASRLDLNLSNNRCVVDRAIVSFGGGQQLSKFMFRENSTKVYIPMEGKDYAVVSAEGMGEMPVNFKAEKSGSYTISAKGEEVNFTYLHLIDNMTGADIDLLATPSYSFDASTTDYESRFRLLFATGSSEDGDTFGFVNGAGNLSIYGIEGEATLQVMDVNGRVLSTETFSGSYEKSLNVAAGIYMLRLTNGDNVRVQKMVIR